MRLYNTMAARVEEFIPRGPDQPVTVYVCGITPYDVSHLGHALVGITYDVLLRLLRHTGHTTCYVQNVTDIDDDILRRAREIGVPWDELGREQTALYLDTLDRLNVMRPDVYAKATEETAKMIEIIGGLLEGGHAYERQGNLYFRVASHADYGALSKLDRAAMLQIAAERGGNVADPLKDDPLDFLLWQATAPGEPTWPSPWGPGRPGWHIECSAMSMRYLGDTIDIHGGGTDLIYPHHESEIAQSQCFTGQPFVRYWMHVGMLRYEGEKMSKSLGNLVMAPRLLENFSADAIRICLMGHRYRESRDFDDEQMDAAEAFAERLRGATQLTGGAGSPLAVAGAHEAFVGALEDDLDTPRALAVLRRLVTEIETGHAESRNLDEARVLLRELSGVLGLTLA